MTTLLSTRAQNLMASEFAIAELAKELENAHDLIEVYKVALAEENRALNATKQQTKAYVTGARVLIDRGDDKQARILLTNLLDLI